MKEKGEVESKANSDGVRAIGPLLAKFVFGHQKPSSSDLAELAAALGLFALLLFIALKTSAVL